ncbi:protein of unknown function [Alcaligenes faecalis subsp. faecalis]|nr:protein of unknown function [Alcaligenes faecalis subsp. faecalis]
MLFESGVFLYSVLKSVNYYILKRKKNRPDLTRWQTVLYSRIHVHLGLQGFSLVPGNKLKEIHFLSSN